MTPISLQSTYEQAMTVLRQIAGMPRKTREQRLTSSCVTFIDALEARNPVPNNPKFLGKASGASPVKNAPEAAKSERHDQ